MEPSPILLHAHSVHRGPAPGVVACVSVGLFIFSVVISNIMTHGAAFPRPFVPFEAVSSYYLRYSDAVRISSMLQFGSAIPLGIFVATLTSRLKFLGVRVAGVEIANFGGYAATLFIAISALSSWALAQLASFGETSSMHFAQLLTFIAGGVAHDAGLGLLLAGVSISAGLSKFIPRWLMWFGLAVACCCELSVLSMVIPAFSAFIPLGRFPGFAWMIATGFIIPASLKND